MSEQRRVMLDEQAAVTPKSVSIEQWTPAGEEKPTQVHIVLELGDGNMLAIRFKSAEGAQRFVVTLTESIAEVWPESEIAREWRS